MMVKRVKTPTVIGNVPVPDPTQLTTEAVERAIAWFREVVTIRLEVITARLDAMDTATKLVAKDVEKLTPDVKEWIDHLRQLDDVKFAAIGQQFVERDVRSTKDAVAADSALKAALQAAKELGIAQNEWVVQANAKTETSFGQQIKSMDDKIAALTQRLDRGESAGDARRVIHQETKSDKQVGSGQQILVISLIAMSGLALLALIANIAIAVVK